MSRSSSGTRRTFWRADWLLALVVIVVVVVVNRATDAIGTLERRFYDFASTSAAREPSDRIAVIAIDDQSIANIGRWPWPRDVHAQLIDKLAAAKAKTIVYTTFFFEPQADPGLVFIRKIKDALGADAAAAANPQVSQLIEQAERRLDTDGVLAASIARAGNVLLPSVYQLGEPQGKPDHPLPAYVARDAISENSGFSESAISGQYPLAVLGEASAGVGHLNEWRDEVDGAVRAEPLLVNYYGKAVPSMALLAAARSLNLGPADIRLVPGEAVVLGKLRIRTDAAARMLPQFYKSRDGKPPFQVDSFYDVLSGKIPPGKYTDKIVLVGATAAGVGTTFSAPGQSAVSPAELMAHVTSSILREHFIVQPWWGDGAQLAVFLLISGYLLALLPRLSAGMGAAATGTLLVALGVGEFALLSAGFLWLELMLPVTLLVIGHLALTTKRFLVTEAGKLKSDDESAETNRMMGLALQGQGQLDMAFDRFRRVPMSDPVMENLYNLALDFERKRQFNKAQAVYEHMAAWNKDFKDLASKLNRAKNLSETVILGGGAHPGGTILLEGGDVEKPMLGRYQLEKELGKGAMGIVYLGKDPKIGRVVAIKTMALGQEFSGDELVDARERFFREAETAGRLQHQNIVTIFDAGEEHDLAYIAMEFLKGRDLADYGKPGQLLPVASVVAIVAQVADALGYAHRQHVVHRDIKPANIMYEPDTGAVKVTDFGIARITDSSKTKTGLVLGTPSYMSPEQIAGKKVDGRSDLYSLGVMLFQMLTGVLPFRGDSMAELMYKIANEEAPDIRVLRSELPERLAKTVALALCKRPEERYQTGEQFAADLRLVLPELPAAEATAAPSPAQFDRTIVAQAGQFTPAPGYDPGRPAAEGEPGRFARTGPLEASDPAGGGREPSEGKAQTGKI